MKANTPAVTSPGLAMGSMMRQKAVKALHPSIRAALSSSLGRERKKGRVVTTMKGMLMVAMANMGPK